MDNRRGNERQYPSQSNERHVRLNEREQRSGNQQSRNRSQNEPPRSCQRGTDSMCQDIAPDRREHDYLGLQRSKIPEDIEDDKPNSICPNPYRYDTYSGNMGDKELDESNANYHANMDRQGYQKAQNASRDCAMMGRSMRVNNINSSKRDRTQNSSCCNDIEDEFAPKLQSTRIEYSRSYDECEAKPRPQEFSQSKCCMSNNATAPSMEGTRIEYSRNYDECEAKPRPQEHSLPKCRIANNATLHKPNQINASRTCAIYPTSRQFNQEPLMDDSFCRKCDDYKQAHPPTTGRHATFKKPFYCPTNKNRQMKLRPLRRSPEPRAPTYAHQIDTSDSMEDLKQAYGQEPFSCSENTPREQIIDYRPEPYYVEEIKWEDESLIYNNNPQDSCKMACNNMSQSRSRSMHDPCNINRQPIREPNKCMQNQQPHQQSQWCIQDLQCDAPGLTRSQFFNLDISPIEPVQYERRTVCDECTNTSQVAANSSLHSLFTQTMAAPLLVAACQTSGNVLQTQTQMSRSTMRPNRTQSTPEENFIKRGKEAQFKNLVLDHSCPGAIQESLNGTANFNEQAQDILFAGVLPQKPKPDPITMIEALQMRIEHERGECQKFAADSSSVHSKSFTPQDVTDYFSTKLQTDLNVALAAYLRVESVATPINEKVPTDGFTANVNKIHSVYPGAPILMTHVTGDTNPIRRNDRR